MNLFCFKLQLLGKDTYYFSNRSELIVTFCNYLQKIGIKQGFLFFLNHISIEQ